MRSDGEVACFAVNCTGQGSSGSPVTGSATLRPAPSNATRPWWDISSYVLNRAPTTARSVSLYPYFSTRSSSFANMFVSSGGPYTSVFMSPVPEPGELCVSGFHSWVRPWLQPPCASSTASNAYFFADDDRSNSGSRVELIPCDRCGSLITPDTTDVKLISWKHADMMHRNRRVLVLLRDCRHHFMPSHLLTLVRSSDWSITSDGHLSLLSSYAAPKSV